MKLGEMVRFDEKGLVPAIVQDANGGEVLMLAYMNREALELTVETGVAHYYSRSRGKLWRKGETSNNTQDLVAARLDCDADTVLFRVMQQGPACHTGVRTCFGDAGAGVLAKLHATLRERKQTSGQASKLSYTQKLLADAELVAAKLREETEEVITAPDRDNLRWECADLLYHLLVRMVAEDITPDDVFAELRGRMK